ncbi:sigma factor [Streptomyces griseorubiginosus]|uniref:sigma factor n=1 Tax=Streptomyces griseorubiginosus TaxID=67304 RepID=UPI0035CD3328
MAFAAARTAPLFRSACVLTSGDAHLAEDLVQDTLGRMYANWRKIAQVDDPAAYTHTVLVRTYLSYRRRRSNSEQPTDTLPDSGAAPGPTFTGPLPADQALARLPALLPTGHGLYVTLMTCQSPTRNGPSTRTSPILPLSQLRTMATSPKWR